MLIGKATGGERQFQSHQIKDLGSIDVFQYHFIASNRNYQFTVILLLTFNSWQWQLFVVYCNTWVLTTRKRLPNQAKLKLIS